ncbi:hypothetical protein CERSUDRAFT_73861 [Gelatoporia subvermispora B]|uniref:Uncharacterized protein n=1 Tax=Ceriporiopsis subvermispora (strain B) TaxID=914234 RepID=M2RDB5_CERS8|nr:hypothetical protein CERSUDRAFT_73861 [Gelatoporia subvermispora B]
MPPKPTKKLSATPLNILSSPDSFQADFPPAGPAQTPVRSNKLHPVSFQYAPQRLPLGFDPRQSEIPETPIRQREPWLRSQPVSDPGDTNNFPKTLEDVFNLCVPKLNRNNFAKLGSDNIAATKSKTGSTKALTAEEIKIGDSNEGMEHIIHVPELVDQLWDASSNLLRSVTFDWDNPRDHQFLATIHPYYTAKGTANKYASEKDVEDWCFATIFKPALLAAWEIRTRSHEEMNSEYFSSSPYGKVQPDSMLVIEPKDREEYLLSMMIEYKTPAAWQNKFTNVIPGATGGMLDDILHLDKRTDVSYGPTIRFQWPTVLDSSKASSQTRVLSQMWTQLVFMTSNHGAIPTGQTCVFYARDPDTRTLYLSRQYEGTTGLFRAAFSWVALSLGLIPADSVHVPPPETSNWPLGEAPCSGVDSRTLRQTTARKRPESRSWGPTIPAPRFFNPIGEDTEDED